MNNELDENKDKPKENKVCQKRIEKELKILKASPIDDNIFLQFPKNNREVRVLMIGSSDTPYENGFFFFDVKIPETYPFSPPKIKYYTLDRKKQLRFNPNLYRNGKVCISIINTWNGPTWTPCNTIASTILSIQGMVLTKHALKNEPGYDKSSKKTLDEYDNIISYGALNIGVLDMIENVPNKFKKFQPIMKDFFMKKYEWFMNECKERSLEHDGKKYISKIYNFEVVPNYKELGNRFKEIYENYKKDDNVKAEKIKNSKCIAICKNGKECKNKKKNDDYCGIHKKKQMIVLT